MNNLDEVAPEDEPRTYRQQSYPRRMLVITAGSVMHMIIAIALIIGGVRVTAGGSRRPAGSSCQRRSARSRRRRRRLRDGDDIVLSIDGVQPQTTDEFVAAIRSAPARATSDHPSCGATADADRRCRPRRRTPTGRGPGQGLPRRQLPVDRVAWSTSRSPMAVSRQRSKDLGRRRRAERSTASSRCSTRSTSSGTSSGTNDDLDDPAGHDRRRHARSATTIGDVRRAGRRAADRSRRSTCSSACSTCSRCCRSTVATRPSPPTSACARAAGRRVPSPTSPS